MDILSITNKTHTDIEEREGMNARDERKKADGGGVRREEGCKQRDSQTNFRAKILNPKSIITLRGISNKITHLQSPHPPCLNNTHSPGMMCTYKH